MRVWNVIWALGSFGFFAWLGVSVLLGMGPETSWGIDTFDRLFALTDQLSRQYGFVTVGLGLILTGFICAVACLNDSGRGGSDCYDDGGDGGD